MADLSQNKNLISIRLPREIDAEIEEVQQRWADAGTVVSKAYVLRFAWKVFIGKANTVNGLAETDETSRDRDDAITKIAIILRRKVVSDRRLKCVNTMIRLFWNCPKNHRSFLYFLEDQLDGIAAELDERDRTGS